jgi:hypothetical protein
MEKEKETETETIKEENDIMYILDSIQNINHLINKTEYKRAFWLLILVLEKLDYTEKGELIHYYSTKMELCL